ncbi:MAG TPA: site-2 protease family protein, partial [Actinomycetota bacterium]|nr:site-2 protease family protein [Actinomycetota bacterium]
VDYTRFRAGQQITVIVERDGERRTFRVTPIEDLIDGQVVGRLGVILTPGTILERERLGPGAAVGRAGSIMGEFVGGTFSSLGRIFGPEGLSRLGRQLFGNEPRDPTRDPTGVVGAARLSGQATAAGRLDELLFLFVAFNIFVGIMNLLPLPPLDGGHLAMVAIEKLRGGRPVDPRRLLPLTAAVVALLFLFFISVTFLDITEPLPNPFE